MMYKNGFRKNGTVTLCLSIIHELGHIQFIHIPLTEKCKSTFLKFIQHIHIAHFVLRGRTPTMMLHENYKCIIITWLYYAYFNNK